MASMLPRARGVGRSADRSIQHGKAFLSGAARRDKQLICRAFGAGTVLAMGRPKTRHRAKTRHRGGSTMTRRMTVGLATGAAMLGAVFGGAAPALAAMAAITTVAPVGEDATEDNVKAAAASALGRAVRGAQAMGLDEVTLKSIRMVPGAGVVVEILATDAEPSLEDSAAAPEPLAPSGAPRI
jgi:hypothetical protein